MAEMTAPLTRLLGFVPLAGLAATRAALAAVPGPEPRLWRAPDSRGDETIAAVAQAEPDTALSRRDRDSLLASLRTVQRRLEIACQAGPFLPMDPAAACCPEDGVARLLEPAWAALAAGLARHGARHQWDIALRWRPEPVVSRARAEIAAAAARGGPAALAAAVSGALRAERDRRAAALIAALAPAVRGIAAGGAVGGETEVAVTVLVDAGATAAVEAALEGLAPEHVLDAAIDMRGPLPPLSFHPVRLATTEQGDISSAWRRLDLPPRVTRDSLHRHWRLRAAAAHPDRAHRDHHAAPDDGVAEITDAYRLLRDLLPAAAADRDQGGDQDGDHGDGLTLRDALRRAGPRLVLPAGLAAEPAGTEPVGTEPRRAGAETLLAALS